MYRRIESAIIMTIFMTLCINQIEADKLKKKLIMKGLSAGLLLNTLTPSKGIIPLPLPVPMPLPIELESSPVVVHQKPHIVAVPHPVPIPVRLPVHIPVHHHHKQVHYIDNGWRNDQSTSESYGEEHNSPWDW